MQHAIHNLLAENQADDRALVEQLGRLANQHGEPVYREALQQLVGKDFPPELAARYWQEALQLQSRDCRPDCSYRGVRSSLLSYLFQVVGAIRDPRIIEADELASYRHASVTDGLTGLYHQTYFKAHLEQLVQRLQRDSSQGFALVMFDLDHFKQFNDRCGHLAGDQALRQVAEILQQSIRQGDLAARYGGEEFALILHRLNRPQAAMVADRIRQAVEDFAFAGQEKLDRGNLTVSGGLAYFPGDGDSARELLQLADERLYRAKQRRNIIFPLNQDQRRTRRQPLHSMVEYALGEASTFRPALSRDLSATGMALACDAEPQPGTRLEVKFRQPFWPCDYVTSGVVRNIAPSRDGRLTRVGLQFEETEAEITRLLGGSTGA